MRKLWFILCALLVLLPCVALSELFVVTPTPLATATPRITATPKPTPTPKPTNTPKPSPTVAPTAQEQIRTDDGSWPALNAKGFVDEGEFIYKDVDKGVWRYCSPTLKVEIIRYQTTSPRLCWYEAEIWSDGEAFHMLSYNDSKPMTKSNYPYLVARKNKSVFAITTDYGHSRLFGNSGHPGIIIRNRVVYSDKTRVANSDHFPNLDVLALYPDGDMQVYPSDSHTAQEYLDMGVESTLAFGPIMVEDGKINQLALTKYGKSKNPRMAIGMFEKGHYLVIMAEGRSNVSSGVSVPTLTNMMYDKGCTLAFNLDGGGTACMTFMGNQITRIGNFRASQKSARSTPEMLSIGQSLQVPFGNE